MYRHPKKLSSTIIGLAVICAGCDSVGEGTTTTTSTTSSATTLTTTATNPYNINLTIVGPGSAIAGELVELELQVVDPEGDDISTEVNYEVNVDLASAVVDGTTLTMTEATLHTIDVTASWGEFVDAESAFIDVNAGDAMSLDLTLSDSEVSAGYAVEALIETLDAYGNTTDEEVTLSTTPKTGLILDGLEITGELMGDYEVMATTVNTGLTDSSDLTVVFGDAITLELTLSDTTANIGGSIETTVTATDEYGNTNPSASYTLTTSPDTTTIDGSEVTFDTEGSYTVTAEEGGLTDDAGPVLVDDNGPVITISTPNRGEYVSGSPVTISGTADDLTAGTDWVTVNGNSVSVDASGAFSTTITPSEGVNTFTVAASDVVGNEADYIASFMYGSYVADDDAIEEAMEVWLNDEGLDFITDEALASFDMDTLEDQLFAMNPLLNSSSGGGLFCWYDYKQYFEFTGMSYGATDASLDPKAAGYLQLTFTIDDLVIDLYGEIEECVVADDFTMQITSSTVTIQMDNDISVDADGNIEVTASNTSVTMDNFNVSTGGAWLDDIAALLGYDIEDMVYDLIVDELESTMEDSVPPAIEDAFSGISIDTEFDMVGTSVGLTGDVTGVDINAWGIALQLSGDADGGTIHPDIPGNPGSLLLTGPLPGYGASTEVAVGLSFDLLNQILHEAWQVGALNMTVLNDEIGLEPVIIGLLFNGASTIDISIYPLMAPVITEGAGAAPMSLDIGELQLDAWGDVSGKYTYLGTFAVALQTDLELSLDSGLIVLTPGAPVGTTDYINPDLDTVARQEALETTLDALLPDLIPSVIEEMVIEMPEIAGVSLNLTSADLDGNWIVVSGEID